MKVWVETCKENGLSSYRVFSSKENVVQYWKDMGLAEKDGDIHDNGDVIFVSKPERLVGRAALEVEVDEYYTRNGGQNEG